MLAKPRRANWRDVQSVLQIRACGAARREMAPFLKVEAARHLAVNAAGFGGGGSEIARAGLA